MPLALPGGIDIRQFSNIGFGGNAGASIGSPSFGGSLINVATGLDGSRVVASNTAVGQNRGVIGGVDVRQQAAAAVTQSDLLPLNLTDTVPYVVYLGQVYHFLDLSATPLAPGDLQMIDPNGVPHDLAVWTVTKDMSNFPMPGLPPGLYTFTNLSGGAISGLAIYAVHIGARNLA